MNKLQLKNIPVKFDEEGHVYTNTETGELLTGVTTILEAKSRDFLHFWTVKEAVRFLGWFDPEETDPKEGVKILKQKFAKLKKLTPKEYYKILDEARLAWSKKSKNALNKGTIIHNWLKEYIAGNNPKIPEDKEVLSSINAFLNFEKQHHVEWLASELMVASLTHKFAGTLDFIAKIDGILTLGDFKTSNQMSEDYDLQLAGYMIALKEMLKEGEGVPSQRMIIRISKNGGDFEIHICDPSLLQFDCETFLHLRQIHKWMVYHENRKNNI